MNKSTFNGTSNRLGVLDAFNDRAYFIFYLIDISVYFFIAKLLCFHLLSYTVPLIVCLPLTVLAVSIFWSLPDSLRNIATFPGRICLLAFPNKKIVEMIASKLGTVLPTEILSREKAFNLVILYFKIPRYDKEALSDNLKNVRVPGDLNIILSSLSNKNALSLKSKLIGKIASMLNSNQRRIKNLSSLKLYQLAYIWNQIDKRSQSADSACFEVEAADTTDMLILLNKEAKASGAVHTRVSSEIRMIEMIEEYCSEVGSYPGREFYDNLLSLEPGKREHFLKMDYWPKLIKQLEVFNHLFNPPPISSVFHDVISHIVNNNLDYTSAYRELFKNCLEKVYYLSVGSSHKLTDVLSKLNENELMVATRLFICYKHRLTQRSIDKVMKSENLIQTLKSEILNKFHPTLNFEQLWRHKVFLQYPIEQMKGIAVNSDVIESLLSCKPNIISKLIEGILPYSLLKYYPRLLKTDIIYNITTPHNDRMIETLYYKMIENKKAFKDVQSVHATQSLEKLGYGAAAEHFDEKLSNTSLSAHTLRDSILTFTSKFLENETVRTQFYGRGMRYLEIAHSIYAILGQNRESLAPLNETYGYINSYSTSLRLKNILFLFWHYANDPNNIAPEVKQDDVRANILSALGDFDDGRSRCSGGLSNHAIIQMYNSGIWAEHTGFFTKRDKLDKSGFAEMAHAVFKRWVRTIFYKFRGVQYEAILKNNLQDQFISYKDVINNVRAIDTPSDAVESEKVYNNINIQGFKEGDIDSYMEIVSGYLEKSSIRFFDTISTSHQFKNCTELANEAVDEDQWGSYAYSRLDEWEKEFEGQGKQLGLLK